jgi:hypothetical protein
LEKIMPVQDIVMSNLRDLQGKQIVVRADPDKPVTFLGKEYPNLKAVGEAGAKAGKEIRALLQDVDRQQ